MSDKENIDFIIKELSELQSLNDALAVCNPVPPSLLKLILDKTRKISSAVELAIEEEYENRHDDEAVTTHLESGSQELSENKVAEEVVLDNITAETVRNNELHIEEVLNADITVPEIRAGKSLELSAKLTLNERFRFVRNLFNGDDELMLASFDDLNKLSDLDEMKQYLSSRFQWDWESEPVLDFILFLERNIN